MRIGIDARQLISKNSAGIGTYVKNIITYFKENDFENEYILYAHKPFESEWAFPSNFSVRIVKGKIGTFWLRYQIPKIIKKDQIDVFWGPEHVLPKKVKGIKYVLTVHDLALVINKSWGKRTNAFIQNTFLKASCKDADMILADSNSTKNDLIQLFGTPKEKIEVIYLGGVNDDSKLISDVQLKEAKEKYKISDSFFYYVGTIEPRKNIETIIKAFENIAHDYPTVDLVLAGGLGWRYDGILELIENSNYKERIKLTGFVSKEEKVNLFTGSIAFLFPSHYEGFGIPILEAMTLGSVVITNQLSSLPEVAGNAAIYMNDKNNDRELSECMIKVMNFTEEERNKYIQKGKEQAKTFSWEKCAKETRDTFFE